ncbi:amino acid adenylation domain-containing protein [Pedobacter sp. WC2423]|uniref:non-ribosomal peptide synthetase n=1 Tax=Pedobacter sp. WC2423 TaxID=3234142 RepID=UPI003467CA36
MGVLLQFDFHPKLKKRMSMRSLIFQEKLLNSLKLNKDLVAIEENDQFISYAELSSAANKITRFLLDQHLEKETIVGISVDTKFQLISSIIGIVNARCVFVPLDSSLPDHRLKEMIHAMNMNFIITAGGKQYKESITQLNRISIEDMLVQEEQTVPLMPVDYQEHDSLYIYFTSGSTGKSKGIIGKNSSLSQFLEWEIEKFNFTSGGRFSQLISPYFDAFLRDIFVPLLTGGTICIHPADEDFFSLEKMTNWIDQNRINVIHCVPSMFRVINDQSLIPAKFQLLTHVLLSGEKIVPSELTNWYNVFDSRIQLVNLYGTTETTMIRAYYEIKPEDARSAKIPIGYPIADTELLISNADFKPCQPLVPGDLYIISKYTTKGYLNDPALTAEKFIKLNAGTPEETIAFKTGDKARRLADGKIDLLGRDDRQVKIRGIRIELDEIEHLLLKSSWVKNAIVVFNANAEPAAQSITAFIIRKDEIITEGPVDDLIKQYLSDHLPAYMLPSAIIEVNEFPLLSNGKTNIKELLNSVIKKDIVLPANELESELLVIWKEIFGDHPISAEEGFQNLGGNSLSILALVSKIYKQYNVRLSLSQIFSHNSIQKQAVFIAQIEKDNNSFTSVYL